MTSSMRAAVIHGPGDLRIEDRPPPRPGGGEILIRTLAASICNATDVHIWEGELEEGIRPPFPHILGHERCGEVVELGDGVTGFSPGDRIALWAKMDGAFAEFDVLPVWRYPVVQLGAEVSDDAGSLLEFVGATLRALHSARLRPGERVLVLGLGVQGMMLSQEAKLLGAARVVGVDLLPFRLDHARRMGVDVAFDLSGQSEPAAYAALREALGGEADLVIDATGKDRWDGGSSINLALRLLRWSGRLVLYALPTREVRIDTRLVAGKGLTVRGIDTPPHEVAPLLELGASWVASGKLRLEELITHRVPLERVEEGLRLCRDRPHEVLKVMVTV